MRNIKSDELSVPREERSFVIVRPPDEKTLSEAADVDGIDNTFREILLRHGNKRSLSFHHWSGLCLTSIESILR